jgi:hypothetical protein
MTLNEKGLTSEQLRQLAAAAGDVRFEDAVAAYEDARVDGLCHDGAWEIALQVARAGGESGADAADS